MNLFSEEQTYKKMGEVVCWYSVFNVGEGC